MGGCGKDREGAWPWQLCACPCALLLAHSSMGIGAPWARFASLPAGAVLSFLPLTLHHRDGHVPRGWGWRRLTSFEEWKLDIQES